MRKISADERERLFRLRRTAARAARRRRDARRQPVKRARSESLIIEHYALRIKQKKERRRKEVTLEVPKTFSFIESPDSAIEFLSAVVRAVRARTPSIKIDHSACKRLDLCAEAVLSAIAFEGRQALGSRFSGWLPVDNELRSIALASGLPKFLGGAREEFKEFHCFPLRHGHMRRERARRSSEREHVATELTTYFESCYSLRGWRLGDDALEFLSTIVGEVIGNAEDHSRERDWWAAAYLRESNNGGPADCHLAIFSFGQTIHQSLLLLGPRSYLRRQLDSLTRTHAVRGFFQPDRWTEENLWTLYALQEGVSRYNSADKALNTDRGQGTADMIEFFQELGGNASGHAPPKMCVVSGATQILFDDKYAMSKKQVAVGFRRRVLAFNASNDLSERPNTNNVRPLKHFFPGTLISLRFFVDDKYLSELHLTGEHNVRPATDRS
jgi:hypothetical protein